VFPAPNKLKGGLTRVNVMRNEVQAAEQEFSVLPLHGCVVPRTCRAPWGS